MFSSGAFKATRRIVPALLLSLLSATPQAWAAEPQQVPGFYRHSVGDYLVTAVYDGYVGLDPKGLTGRTQGEIQALIAREFQAKVQPIQTAVNAFLVQMGDKLILVDSGSSDCFGPTMGQMVKNIEAAGYKPADVQAVLLTHMHPDHACGVTNPDGTAAFPNATVWAEKKDAAFWLSDASAAKLPKDQAVFVNMAQKAIKPYAAAGRFKEFTADQQVFPGVRAVGSHGHTPGHTSFLLQSQKDTLLIWGDIVHFHAVQLPHPEVTIEVDVDPKAAVQSRKDILAQAADNAWLVAAAHHPFPGIGHVRREAVGYSWVPTEYADVRRQEVKKAN
ncbi:MBL fold metallo-hydrolase [Rhizobacter sp. LjRoot28]|uniref:MBL fold metallo-hydrolase n=1 Tax=Rhizobacter sp. LjRoot28 TaxID=3342309 RepID=UPI003ECD7970